ncbi:intermembrane phospholipid transport protein YdbH family protein [Tsuneonella suprasediminis]|uniref:intermembrane phospholipid transport protein YdbH family protein n=1 Tax=Tsuneonella suprasediminis TaxID=2306996 RepID=UPI001403A89A|nr:YdbH domain-containing protein [Tsuneonella suprasediminis]
MKLYSVPLDMVGAAGDWKYANGVLTLANGRFRLEDRASADRFNPLAAEEASLTLKDSVVHATASLRAPDSHREVADVSIVHNLANSTGAADLAVKGLVFDKALQPDQLTDLALGVVANAKGTVRGVGRIDWNAKGITSSGRFSSDALDFAAAFGPVKGASGTVVFTDLLGMTTAPNQTLQIASVNPGIEVDNGSVTFSLKNGQDLAVAGGTWPFMGGTITLHPTKMRFGASEERRYVFEIVGLDAAQFIQRMELENLAATGIFDGTVPIVFDRNGVGRIDHGMLIARAPGGNVSYLGELTYKDKGAIANFAFDVLKSIDYSQMVLTMEGRLTGEIITHVSLDGVRQGEGAKRNFLTRRIAALPIRLNVNISAPFYQLISSIKAMYDPASVRDPRDLGLVSSDGKRLKPAVSLPPSAVTPHDILSEKTPVQPKESENRP